MTKGLPEGQDYRLSVRLSKACACANIEYGLRMRKGRVIRMKVFPYGVVLAYALKEEHSLSNECASARNST